MPSRSWARRTFTALLVIALAGAATWLVHGETLRYGFDYDDYHFLRPYTRAEVLDTLHGPWDLTGIEVKFYRPLTILLYAARFRLFGLNATAHHAASLALFALVAVLTAWFVGRLTGRRMAAVAAVLLVACHPAMPYSLVAWVTNQMHLAETLVALTALLWWHVVRARPLLWWLPLLVCGVAAFMIKEDGLMLLPVVLTLHGITRRVAEPGLRPVPWAFVALAGLLVVSLVAWRSSALGDLGGYGRPTAHAAWVNLTNGLNGVFRLTPAHRPWQGVASAFATLLPLVALAAWRWISPGSRLCLLAGAAVALLFNLPFAFVSKAQQMYLVGVGASIVLTGATMGLLDLATLARARRALKAGLSAVLLVGLGSSIAVTRDITRDFAPFGPIVLAHDDLVRSWGPVPPELREYLASKREPGAARRLSPNPIDELSQVTFGVHERETTADGRRFMWMAGTRAEILLTASARSAILPLRHQIESFRDPMRVRITADGRPADDLAFTSNEWRMSTLPLLPADVPRWSRMHRVVITTDHAWRPSEVIPRSTDARLLGLQIGEATTR